MKTELRIEKIKGLMEDEERRRDKSEWTAIFEDPSLTPAIDDPTFSSDVFAFLTKEMNDGYRRKDELQREKRRTAGTSGRYMPSQMRISPPIGRYIFAIFGWHEPDKTPAKKKLLTDIAEAFNFRIEPKENELQLLSETDRREILEKKSDQEYNSRNWAMLLGGVGIIFSIVMFVIRRYG